MFLAAHITDQMWHQWARLKLLVITVTSLATSAQNAISQVVVHTTQMRTKAIIQTGDMAMVAEIIQIIITIIITIITTTETIETIITSRTTAITAASVQITPQTPKSGFHIGSLDCLPTISTKIGNFFHSWILLH
jgi:hypothetical protein